MVQGAILAALPCLIFVLANESTSAVANGETENGKEGSPADDEKSEQVKHDTSQDESTDDKNNEPSDKDETAQTSGDSKPKVDKV